MGTKSVNLSLPAELLLIIDEAAKASYCNRSDYIRESVVRRLEDQQKGQQISTNPAKPAFRPRQQARTADWV